LASSSTAAIAGTNGASVVTSDQIKVVLAVGVTSAGNKFLDQQQANLGITKTDGSPTYTPGVGPDLHDRGQQPRVPPTSPTRPWPTPSTPPSARPPGPRRQRRHVGLRRLGSGTINDTGITIPAGGSVTYTVVVSAVSPSKTGNLVNTATVSSARDRPRARQQQRDRHRTRQASSPTSAITKTTARRPTRRAPA
jgi:hypothetical protein